MYGEMSNWHASPTPFRGKKFQPKDVKDPVAEKAEYTYQGHLVMFPKGWGLYDLYRRNGLPLPKETIQAQYAAGKQKRCACGQIVGD